MRENKEEIIGAPCLIIFNVLSNLNKQNIGSHAEEAIKKALAVIPRVPGEILTRIDSDATPIIIDALTETEAYITAAAEALDEVELEDDNDIGRFMYLEGLSKECQRALKATGRRLIEKDSYRVWLPLDIWIVAVDETECWQLTDEDLDKCKRIEGIYLFDKNETNRYGEKSCYFLWGLHNRPIFKENVSEEDKNRIRKLVAKTGETADNYLPVSTLDKNIKTICDDKSSCYHFGNPRFDLALSYDEEGGDQKAEIMRIICSWCKEVDILANG